MSRIVEQLRDYINWSFAVTITITVGIFAREPLLRQFSSNFILGLLSSILLIVTIVRYFIYLHAVRTELDILDRVLKAGEIYSVRGRVLPTILVLAVLFGVLIAKSTDILVYSLAFIGLSLADLFGQATVNRNVAIRLVRGAVKAEANEQGFVDPLQAYYIERHLLLHAASFVVISSLALILSIVGRLKGEIFLVYCAIALMILTIIVGESVICQWRKVRDRAIKQLE